MATISEPAASLEKTSHLERLRTQPTLINIFTVKAATSEPTDILFENENAGGHSLLAKQ